MASLKALKIRINSVKSTQKITKAMKMVAAAKLRRAQEAAVQGRPYAERLEGVVASLARNVGVGASPLLAGTGKDQVHLLVVVTAERGLSGPFNTNAGRFARARIRALEAEGKDPIPDAYRLEVSSPGIDRPLTRPQDYVNWAGHEAKVTLVEKIDNRKILTGDLVGIDGDKVTIDVRGYQPMTVGLDQIHDAKLTITDRLLAATAPLSSEGADEFEETDDTDASNEGQQ